MHEKNKIGTRQRVIFLKLTYLFYLEANYNIVVAFALHRHESAMGVHVSPHPEPPSKPPPHPIPLGCPRVPALSALLQAYKENQTYFKQFFFFFLSLPEPLVLLLK